jgi:hypothetical protein
VRAGIVVAAVAALCPGWAAAGELELTVRAGKVVPFYEQSFHLDPSPFLQATFPGITAQAVQDLRLEGHGGLALGGGLTWYVAGGFGIEARVDTADVSVTATDALVRLRIPLFPPLPPLTTDIVIPAETDLERLKPVSLNLKARTGGPFRVYASGGVSYLPSLRFTVHSTFRTAAPILGAPIDLARLSLRAEAQPEGEGEGRLGYNAGGGFTWPLGSHVSLEADARYFGFRAQTLVWSSEPGVTLSPVEQQLVRQLLDTVGESRFNPNFFQATGGLSLRF